MFGKKESKMDTAPSQEIDSLIGEKLRITGKVQGEGNIRIDGEIKGDVDCKGDITISETGVVYGNLSGVNIYISGTVNGNVNAKDKLTLFPSGILKGDIKVANLVIYDNGFFQGKCTMTKEVEKEIQEELETAE
ncbi:MAG: polymer-forming cytoskeletal protein [Tissierellia bacterium]|nr:polymer-forming cytoskeletal protein [Tissierellia bacterium]